MAKAKGNRISKLVSVSAHLPESVRRVVLSKLFGQVVPMVGTAGISYDLVTPEKVICSIKNKRSMQNHINNVHAVAMALLAETATGFLTVQNVSDDSVVLIKSIHMNYKRLSQGDMVAVATLSPDQRQFILDNPKGELMVPVTLTDESGQSPVEAQMLWAWVPKKKKAV